MQKRLELSGTSAVLVMLITVPREVLMAVIKDPTSLPLATGLQAIPLNITLAANMMVLLTVLQVKEWLLLAVSAPCSKISAGEWKIDIIDKIAIIRVIPAAGLKSSMLETHRIQTSTPRISMTRTSMARISTAQISTALSSSNLVVAEVVAMMAIIILMDSAAMKETIRDAMTMMMTEDQVDTLSHPMKMLTAEEVNTQASKVDVLSMVLLRSMKAGAMTTTPTVNVRMNAAAILMEAIMTITTGLANGLVVVTTTILKAAFTVEIISARTMKNVLDTDKVITAKIMKKAPNMDKVDMNLTTSVLRSTTLNHATEAKTWVRASVL